MFKSVIFSDNNSLNFSDIRMNVIRIPEVYAKIKQAQDICDRLNERSYFEENLYSVLMAENNIYNKNIKLKSVLTTIVQLGLYDRYIKKFDEPDFFVGNINGDSALGVLVGYKSFESLFTNMESSEEESLTSINESEPFLSGVTMDLHRSFIRKDGAFVQVGEDKQELALLVQYLIEEKGMRKIIDVGPGSGWKNSTAFDHSLYDIHVQESIDLDPMLSWFWPFIKNQTKALAIAN